MSLRSIVEGIDSVPSYCDQALSTRGPAEGGYVWDSVTGTLSGGRGDESAVAGNGYAGLKIEGDDVRIEGCNQDEVDALVGSLGNFVVDQL